METIQNVSINGSNAAAWRFRIYLPFEQCTHRRYSAIRLLFESRVIKPQSSNYPQNALQIFAENASAKRHNLEMLYSIEGNIFTINQPKTNSQKAFLARKLLMS